MIKKVPTAIPVKLDVPTAGMFVGVLCFAARGIYFRHSRTSDDISCTLKTCMPGTMCRYWPRPSDEHVFSRRTCTCHADRALQAWAPTARILLAATRVTSVVKHAESCCTINARTAVKCLTWGQALVGTPRWSACCSGLLHTQHVFHVSFNCAGEAEKPPAPAGAVQALEAHEAPRSRPPRRQIQLVHI